MSSIDAEKKSSSCRMSLIAAHRASSTAGVDVAFSGSNSMSPALPAGGLPLGGGAPFAGAADAEAGPRAAPRPCRSRQARRSSRVKPDSFGAHPFLLRASRSQRERATDHRQRAPPLSRRRGSTALRRQPRRAIPILCGGCDGFGSGRAPGHDRDRHAHAVGVASESSDDDNGPDVGSVRSPARVTEPPCGGTTNPRCTGAEVTAT